MLIFIDKIINRVIFVLLIIIILLFAYCVYDAYPIERKINISENSKLYLPDTNEYNNPNIIGWIEIYNTIIDYPILQGKNNTDYLTLNYKNEYSSFGSIFLDYRNNKNFKDGFNIIYGHNMKHKAMFSELKNYKDTTYLNTHNKGRIYLKNQQYDINIILYKEVNDSDDIPYNLYLYKNNYNEKIYYYLTRKKVYEDKLLVLSTCKSGEKNKRVILFCTLNKI